ncbi:MAG: hypothetical protein ACP5JE_04950, partial [Thermoplasmata archaeon]
GMNEELEKLLKSETGEQNEVRQENQDQPVQQENVENKENDLEKVKDELLLDAFEKKVAYLTDEIGNIIDTIPLSELFDKLSTQNINAKTLITGGVISQRLVDISAEKGIEEIYGVKMLNVTKKPANLKIIVKNEI